ncbi:MAG: DUF4340 domain-containing protein [Clostridia bacterium]|nr:DUF4340 domain-containing protein [Clostridia bacterium]
MRNRLIITSVILALCLVLGIVYAVVILPEPNAPVSTEETTTLAAGEVEGFGGRVQMFDHVKSENVASIFVNNSHGSYKIIGKGNGSFAIEGYEHIMLNGEKLTQMIINAGYTLSTFNASVNEEDFVKYGLAEGESEAYFVLTTLDGKRYTVYVGDETLAGSGYYARYEGRNSVYVLDDSIENDILAPVTNLVDPLLAYPSDLKSYYLVRNFVLFHGEEIFLKADYLNPEQRSELAATSVHRLSIPAEYDAGENYDDVLALFCSYVGKEVLSIDLTEEILAKYGLLKPAYQLYFDSTVLDSNGNPSSVVSNLLAYSERQQDENGNYFYYVASSLFGIIAKIDAICADFLTWDLDKWVSSSIFQINIMNVSSLSLKGKDVNANFLLSGDKNENLSVFESVSGKTPDISNFRNFWKVLLFVTHDGAVTLSEKEVSDLVADESNLLLELAVKTRAGQKRVLRFYPYSDRRVYYTVNGEGEFYLSNTLLYKAIADANRVINGETVDPDSRY